MESRLNPVVYISNRQSGDVVADHAAFQALYQVSKGLGRRPLLGEVPSFPTSGRPPGQVGKGEIHLEHALFLAMAPPHIKDESAQYRGAAINRNPL